MHASKVLLASTAISATLAIPTQPALLNATGLPLHYGVVIFPGFQALDVFGPLDVFNTLAMDYQNISMNLSVFAKTREPVTTRPLSTVAFGESIAVTHTFDEVLADGSNVPELDVLLVPGGGGTRSNVTAEIDFIKALYPNVKYLMSVCTGATLLARAGALDGKKATTNKKAWAWATSQGPKTTWIALARWIQDGKIWTSSGISAGTDLAYAWISHVFGDDISQYLAESLEYQRWTNASYDPFGEIWGATNVLPAFNGTMK